MLAIPFLIRLALTVVVAVPSFSEAAQPDSPETGPALLPARNPHFVELSGTGYKRGLQYGKALKTEIADAVQRWKDDLRASRKQDPDTVIAAFLRETNFLPAIRKWTPDLLEEVRGIAEGAGQPFDTMLAFQCVDEIWVYFDDLDAHHCSGVGVARRGSSPAFVSQNLDLESFRNGSQTVLHIRPTATTPEQLIFTVAGLIAANGMNRAPVAVAVNTLMQLRASRDGLPVAFVIRGLLVRTSEREVLGFLKDVKHASGQNYIVGIGDRVFDFEASANGVVRYQLVPGGSPVFHTNHPLANKDLKSWYTLRLAGDSSVVRFASLDLRLGQKESDVSERAVKTTLRSRDSALNPVCRSLGQGGAGFTFGSVVMTLSKHPTMQVTVGPPDASEYVSYSFDTGGIASPP